MSAAIELSVAAETFPMDGTFSISRGSRTSSEVVLAALRCGRHLGRGECVPYARYGESLNSVIESIQSCASALRDGMDRQQLQHLLPAGAARNALDCALWDLQAKTAGVRVWELAGIATPTPEITAYTLSLDSPDAMRASAAKHAERPLLKIKLAGEGDVDRVAAVVAGAPNARLVVDANEGWTPQQYQQMVPQLAELGVAMIEQPFPADADQVLDSLPRPVPLCADESCHDRASLGQLAGRYDIVNIKLDKTGGLTEALALREAALQMGFDIMIGCMVATSLAMAPATLVASNARVVDLDGPLLLASDRSPPLDYSNYCVAPPQPDLWG